MENQKETKEEKCLCPNWFKLVSCVILYKYDNEDNKKKILLRQRDDKTWAISGGVGAFKEKISGEETKDILDFSREEIRYDLSIEIADEDLKKYRFTIDSTKQELRIFFYCNGGKCKYQNRIKANVNSIIWFSVDEIKEMNKRGKIAFNNGEVLEKFYDEILSKL